MNILIFLALIVISLAVDCQIHGTLLKTCLDLSIQAEQKIPEKNFRAGQVEIVKSNVFDTRATKSLSSGSTEECQSRR